MHGPLNAKLVAKTLQLTLIYDMELRSPYYLAQFSL